MSFPEGTTARDVRQATIERWFDGEFNHAANIIDDVAKGVTNLIKATPVKGFSDVRSPLITAERGMNAIAQIQSPFQLNEQLYKNQRSAISSLEEKAVANTLTAFTLGRQAFSTLYGQGTIGLHVVNQRDLARGKAALIFFNRKPFEEDFTSPEEFVKTYAAALLRFHREHEHAYWRNDGK